MSEIIPSVNGLKVYLASLCNELSLTAIKKDMMPSTEIRLKNLEKKTLF